MDRRGFLGGLAASLAAGGIGQRLAGVVDPSDAKPMYREYETRPRGGAWRRVGVSAPQEDGLRLSVTDPGWLDLVDGGESRTRLVYADGTWGEWTDPKAMARG